MKKYEIITIIGLCVALCVLIVVVFAVGSNNTTKVSLGEYMGVEIEFYETVVTDKDIDNAVIDAITKNQENIEISNRPVRKGDIANIDYSGKVDGIEFDGGTSTDYDLEIGSGTFIEGFEDQVIGMEIGQTADIIVTFSDSYRNTDLAGAEAVFTVKVNSIYGIEIPEKITDDMVKEVSDIYTTVEEYREYIRLELETEVEETNNYNKQEAVWKVVLENTTVSNLSGKKVSYYSELFESNYQYYADLYGVDLTTLIASYMGITKEEFDDEKSAYAEETAIRATIIEAIAKEQVISVSDDEYQEYLTENGFRRG